MEDEGMKDVSPAEIITAIDKMQAKAKEDFERVKSKTRDGKPLIDALRLVDKCRRSKGGGVCDPCWAEVTKALKDLDVRLWGF